MDNIAEIRDLLTLFGFRQEDCRCSVLTGGTANKNFIIHDSGKTYILRLRNAKYSSDEWVAFEEEYLNYVSGKGIPVPVPVPNAQGRSWINLDGKVYHLYTFIDGGGFEMNNPAQIAEGGAFLGRLHNAVSDFVPLAGKPLPRYDNPQNIVNAVRQTLQNPALDATGAEAEILRYILRTAEQIQSVIPDSRYHQLYKLCIHGDYHPANVKYANDTVCGLFDFDWISMQPRLRDVVDGIIYFSAIRSVGFDGSDIFSLTQTCRFDYARSRLFAEAYRKTCDRPLDADEISIIPLLMQARLLHSRVEALAKIPASRRVEMLTKGIAEPLRWLDDHYEELMDSLSV